MAECVAWPGRLDKFGYGRMSGGRLAHRVAFDDAAVDVDITGLEVHHLCGNRDCVRPMHLVAITKSNHGALHTEARSHCGNGHLLDGKNTYRWRGKRICRACNRHHARAYKERKLT